MKKILVIMIGIMMMLPGLMLVACTPEVSIFFSPNEKYSIENLTEEVEYGKPYSFRVVLEEKYSQSEIVVKANGEELEEVDEIYTIEKVEKDQIVEIDGIEINTYTVTYYNGEEVFETISVEYGNSVIFTETPTKEGNKEYSYQFKEWIDENGEEVDLSSVTSDKEVYATYTEKQIEYVIGKLPKGVILKKRGKELSSTDKLYYGEEITVEATPEEGYEITDLKVYGAVKQESVYKVEDNILVVLKQKKKTFTVQWKNGNTILATDENVEYGTIPTYTGKEPESYTIGDDTYIFIGWGEIEPITEDKVYEAKFKKLETYAVSITFDNEDLKLIDKQIENDFGGVFGRVEIANTKFTENSKVVVKFYLSCLSEEIEIKVNGETIIATREELEDDFLSVYTIEFNIQENSEINLSGFIEEILF